MTCSSGPDRPTEWIPRRPAQAFLDELGFFEHVDAVDQGSVRTARCGELEAFLARALVLLGGEIHFSAEARVCGDATCDGGRACGDATCDGGRVCGDAVCSGRRQERFDLLVVADGRSSVARGQLGLVADAQSTFAVRIFRRQGGAATPRLRLGESVEMSRGDAVAAT